MSSLNALLTCILYLCSFSVFLLLQQISSYTCLNLLFDSLYFTNTSLLAYPLYSILSVVLDIFFLLSACLSIFFIHHMFSTTSSSVTLLSPTVFTCSSCLYDYGIYLYSLFAVSIAFYPFYQHELFCFYSDYILYLFSLSHSLVSLFHIAHLSYHHCFL